MNKIEIKVGLDEQNVPERILWNAPQGDRQMDDQEAKAFFLSLFDPQTTDTLKIDLWTKDMPMLDMHKFMHNTIRALGRSYARATQSESLIERFDQFSEELLELADIKKG